MNDVLDTERTTLHISDGQRKIAFFESLTVEAGVTLSTPQDTVRYQYDNRLGSSCLELDETAATISYEEYHPFGTSSYKLHRNSTEVSIKRYRYVGKERDEETGLYYYGARYYAAWIARFVSVDPLQHKYPQKTPYDYAENRPISGIDLDGLEYISSEDAIIKNVNGIVAYDYDNVGGGLRREFNQGKPQILGYPILSIKEPEFENDLKDFGLENTKTYEPKLEIGLLKPDARCKKSGYMRNVNLKFGVSGGGNKVSNWVTFISEGFKVGAEAYAYISETFDDKKTTVQLTSLYKAYEDFINAAVSGYIPAEILKDSNATSNIINYIFRGDISNPSNVLIGKDENGEYRYVYEENYTKMIEEIGTKIYEISVNNLKYEGTYQIRWDQQKEQKNEDIVK